MNRFIAHNVVANGYGQFVTIGIQLLAIPIFLSQWSVEQYGRWLIISAIPTYLILFDGGLIGAAANRISIHANSGVKELNSLAFSEYGAVTRLLYFVLGALGVASAFFALISSTYGLISPDEACSAFLLSLCTLLAIFTNLLEIPLRATNNNALGVFISNTARFAEWACGSLMLFYEPTFTSVAVGMAASRVLSVLIIWQFVLRNCPNYSGRTLHNSFALVKPMVRPSVAFLAFPIGNSFSIQGLTLIVGLTLGPAAVALLNTYRTLSRTLVQLCTVICHSVWPEFSKLYALGQQNAIRQLLRRTQSIAVLTSGVGIVVLFSVYETVLVKWTHSEITYVSNLAMLYVLSAGLTAFWMPGRVVLMATNKHSTVSIHYMLSSATALLLYYFAAPWTGQYGPPLSIIAIEIYMILATRSTVRKILPVAAMPPLTTPSGG